MRNNHVSHINYIHSVLLSTFLICIIGTSNSSVGQYSIAPTALTIQYPARSTEVIVRAADNAQPLEFTMSSFFAIPETDENGIFRLVELDSMHTQNITTAIRFSPRRFVLSAGQEQVVRVSVMNADDLPDSEYWTRVIASAKIAQPVADANATSLHVSMGLEIRTIAGLLFRKGLVSTGLDVDVIDYQISNDSLNVVFNIERSGNAAWLGTLQTTIYDDTGTKIHVHDQYLSIYRNSRQKLLIPIMSLQQGTYSADFLFKTERNDRSIDLIHAAPISTKLKISVN